MKLKTIVLPAWLAAGACMAQTDVINIDLAKHGAEVSPNLFGIFFEEINHAGDGGLYAELVQNRGFEEHVLPSSMTYSDGRAVAVDSPNYANGQNRHWTVGWNLEQKRMTGWKVEAIGCTADGTVVEADRPLHVNTPHAMQLTITNMAKGGKATLLNTGYWGMGLEQNAKYNLRMYVRSADYKGTVTVRLTDGNSGLTTDRLTLEAKKIKDWTELTGVLTSHTTTANGQLAIDFDAKGTVLVDYVSLFPQNTFKGRANGLRPDLAEMLAGLHPRFMRWPGGCIVEGATYENRVKWKETLGDPMTRRGEWDVWGYRSTWGLGYHEFLQFCEDLGMDAMFVNNAGMSCSVRNGDYTSDLEPVVQDFRDAIDYAIGNPATNAWAKRRAEAGHPAPFPLKYVEIGNENIGQVYVEHFNYIFSRLKAEYPSIIFINTLGHTDRLLSQIPGDYMVDPHWYRNPDFFFSNNHLFDEAPRTHDIYVGEYACNSGVGQGNLLAAISEAAFILGMERNSDVVKMASYAPLFENENHRDWTCNLIHFNSSQVFGRASYYVQKMSAENRATYNVAVSEPSLTQQPPFPLGTIGLSGGMQSKVEYRNIRITTADGKTLQVSPSQLKALRGEWNVDGDVLASVVPTPPADANPAGGGGMRRGMMGGGLTLLPDFSSNSYTLQLQARKAEGAGQDGLTINFALDADGRTGYTAALGSGRDGQGAAITPLAMGGRMGMPPGAQQQAQPSPFTLEAGRWYDIRLVVTPDEASLYVDGTLLATGHTQTVTRHFCLTGYDSQTGELVVKVVNGTDQPYTRTFSISGAKSVAPQGKVITLSGDQQAENSFAQPTLLAPKTTTYGQFAQQFTYKFDPMSYTVLRIKCGL